MSKESISKVYLILEKIDYIEQIVNNNGGIVKVLDDSVMLRPAILMHLTAIAEQFNKLKYTTPKCQDNFFNQNQFNFYYRFNL